MKQQIIFFLILFCISQSSIIRADNLSTATATGSSTTTDAGTYIDVASTTLLNIGSSTSDVTSVMVVATFEVRTAGSQNQNRTATFRLADATNSVYSGTIIRMLEKDKNGDKGIGSLVYIFNVSSYSGNITYKLQHTTDNSNYDNVTSGTIVAIALGTTTNHIQLSNDIKSITTGVTIPNNTYEAVTGLTTDAISLPVSGTIYIAASVNNTRTSGSSQTGYWKLQKRKGLNGTWTDIGYEIARTLTSNLDAGIASLGLIVTGLPRDNYYFRLLHKGSLATPNIETLNTNLIAVALAYDDPTNGGRAFPVFSSVDTDVITTSESLVATFDQPVTPASNTDMFFYAQYNMSATDALDAPTFDMHVTDGSGYTFSSQSQQRRLSSSSDIGSGGFGWNGCKPYCQRFIQCFSQTLYS